MAGFNAVPILVATAYGVVAEEVSILTKASAASKGSYLPKMGVDAAVAVGGALAASRGVSKNVTQALSVGASASLGFYLALVAGGEIKL